MYCVREKQDKQHLSEEDFFEIFVLTKVNTLNLNYFVDKSFF